MAYYRESSPIPGYTGHIPGYKFHIGGGINRKGNIINNHKMIVDEFPTSISNDFDNFSIDDQIKNDESKLPSLLDFEIDEDQKEEEYLNEENDSEIRKIYSEMPSSRKSLISSSRSLESKNSKKTDNSIEMFSNKYELESIKNDNVSLLSSDIKNVDQVLDKNNEIKRPNTVGREQKEKLKKKMENMKSTGIWDKKPIPYEIKNTSINDNISQIKNNPFEDAEKGWWSEGQSLPNIRNIKKNKFNENSYIDYSKNVTNEIDKRMLNNTENSSILNDFKNSEE